jgi:hypothetical protein
MAWDVNEELPGWIRTRNSLIEHAAALESNGMARLPPAETLCRCVAELKDLIAFYSSRQISNAGAR